MPDVRFRYPVDAASVAALQARRLPRTLLGARGITVELDVVRVDGQDFTDLSSLWAETERPGKLPLLDYAGEQLVKMRWQVVMGFDPERSIEHQLAALAAIARAGERVFMARPGSGTPFSFTRGGGYTITELSVRPRRRRMPDNAITVAEVDITFTEMSSLAGTSTTTAPTFSASSSSTSGGNWHAVGPAGVRRHTVRDGESLATIAVDYYGNANLWSTIASANAIRDVRALRIGQVLTIPPLFP